MAMVFLSKDMELVEAMVFLSKDMELVEAMVFLFKRYGIGFGFGVRTL